MTHALHMAEMCREIDIPLMIAESAPFGGIVDNDDLRGTYILNVFLSLRF